MNFEDLQKSWQSQDSAKKLSLNAEVVLAEVRRNQQQFRATILRRDLAEISVAAVLVPIFIVLGMFNGWPLFLCAFGCFVVGAYFAVDRWRQRRKSPESHHSLKDCVGASLVEVNHQIWLLKNVLWWYLLPIYVPLMIFFGWCVWHLPNSSAVLAARIAMIGVKLVVFLVAGVFVTALYWGIYWLNQSAVKKRWEPRRRELESLLNEIEPGNPIQTAKTGRPLGPLLLVLAVCAGAVIAKSVTKTNLAANPTPATGLEAIRQAHDVPALAVVVTKDGQICDRAAAGFRRWGEATPVTTNDVFHIGSCTKSMTATLAAILIEQGKLRWDTTLAEALPELKGKMDKRYEAVTVEQLLHHRGGVPGEPPAAAWRRAWKETGTPTEQRREFIEAVLSVPPAAAPGTKMIYSNQGYAIVGVMLEKISGQNFESLLTEKLFQPLRLDTAGFGPPGTQGKTDQPWGHTRKFFLTSPVQLDNPPAITPAGRVHCSLDDLARYAMFHLQQGTNTLLKPETMARLHASAEGAEIKAVMEDYACGWVRLKRPWAGGPVLWHNGSNTMWYLVMWLAPEKNFCVIAATNVAGGDAAKACDDAARAMIEKWLPK